MNIYDFSPGTAPLLVSMPHCGTYMVEAPPFAFGEALANEVRPVLHALISTLLVWKPS